MSRRAFVGQPTVGCQKPNVCIGKEIVSGLLPAKGLVIIVGAPTSGKSLLALRLAACLATGDNFVTFNFKTLDEDWQHGFPLCAGSTLFLLGEGYESFYKRIEAAQTAATNYFSTRLPNESLPIITLPVYGLCGEDSFTEIEQRIKDIVKYLETFGLPLRAIVFDTLSSTCEILDENSNSEMQRIMSWLRECGERFNCLIIAITHPPKSYRTRKGNIRGAGSVEAAADMVIHVNKIGQSTKRRATITKKKDGLYQDKSFDFEVVQIGGSVALVPLTKQENHDNMTGDNPLSKTYQRISNLVQRLGENGTFSKDVIFTELKTKDAKERLAEGKSPTKHETLAKQLRRGLQRLTELGIITHSNTKKDNYDLANIVSGN